uniref:Ski_Sno domain-containing protein n=1 Tax=Trichuris muris TaxID=70415 RepID=A0A5S6QPK0_TRIMR
MDPDPATTRAVAPIADPFDQRRDVDFLPGHPVAAADGYTQLLEPTETEAEIVEYRGQKVAAFQSADDVLLCLPQAYELFLKHLVGGLHTVYTKLKRLDIVPIVCNVEQVRALRSIGAIQPGVNRCKLISSADFDLLYEDCASSNSRPGRPPKRSSYDSIYQAQMKRPTLMPSPEIYTAAASATYKTSKLSDDQGNAPGCSGAVNGYPVSTLGGLIGAGGFGQQLFPLFPIAAQQILVNQLLTNAGQSSVPVSPSLASGSASRGSLEAEPRKFELCSFDRGRFAEVNPKEELLFPKYRNSLAGSSQEALRRSYVNSEPSVAAGNDCSVEQLLSGISGMIELAIAAAKRQEEHAQTEKEEALKALQEEKQRRMRLELILKEKERIQRTCVMRIKHLKTIIGQLKVQFMSARSSSCSPVAVDVSEAFPLSPEDQQLQDTGTGGDKFLKSETDEGPDSPSASVSS